MRRASRKGRPRLLPKVVKKIERAKVAKIKSWGEEKVAEVMFAGRVARWATIPRIAGECGRLKRHQQQVSAVSKLLPCLPRQPALPVSRRPGSIQVAAGQKGAMREVEFFHMDGDGEHRARRVDRGSRWRGVRRQGVA